MDILFTSAYEDTSILPLQLKGFSSTLPSFPCIENLVRKMEILLSFQYVSCLEYNYLETSKNFTTFQLALSRAMHVIFLDHYTS